MTIIKRISEMIEEELDGAKEYAECALKNKDSHPQLSRVFYDISLQEMQHIDLLHNEVVKIIEAHRNNHGEPPAAMMAVWEYLHDKHIKKSTIIKVMQAEYRAGA